MQEMNMLSVIIPVYNEAETIEKALLQIYQQKYIHTNDLISKDLYEVIIVDNNSTDATLQKIRQFSEKHPDLAILTIKETKQGVAWARKSGMDFAIKRSINRDNFYHSKDKPFYLFSTDADCFVDHYWIDALLKSLQSSHAALGVSHYYYPDDHFENRPHLLTIINLILKARDKVMRIFGGFPDGKGFAILREKYVKIGGIEIFYQLQDGKFVCHLSDDWDFGIKVRASGEEIIYSSNSKVLTNPRRVDHALHEMIRGVAYGQNGIITMKDIRTPKNGTYQDISQTEAKLLFEFSIKDFTTKHIILPVLLSPTMLDKKAVIDFLSLTLSKQLKNRIQEITHQMRISDFTPIHLYKTPCFRLYFEFREALFKQMRNNIDSQIGYPPPLPTCLEEISEQLPDQFNNFVYYYCEDRESGEAHNYFGNGGVF